MGRWAACAYSQSLYMLTRYLITGLPLRSEPAQEKWFQVEQSANISPFGFVGWLYLKHLLGVMTSSFW